MLQGRAKERGPIRTGVYSSQGSKKKGTREQPGPCIGEERRVEQGSNSHEDKRLATGNCGTNQIPDLNQKKGGREDFFDVLRETRIFSVRLKLAIG